MTRIRTDIAAHGVYFDPATEVGAHAEYVSVGPDYVTTAVGTYCGPSESVWEGEESKVYHYFKGGYIGDTPQLGQHGFPAARLVPHAYADRRAYLRTELDADTDQRSLIVSVIDHDSDRVTLTEEVPVMGPTAADERGVALPDLLEDVDGVLRKLGWPRFGRWEIGVAPFSGLFAEARVAQQAPRRA